MTRRRATSWKYCQRYSKNILSDASWTLAKKKIVDLSDQLPTEPGVYLIKHSRTYYYIGQADNLRKRVKQQFSKRSTFYKNYLDSIKPKQKTLDIDDFSLRLLPMKLGRKEMEEFGMVNFKTKLNKFHKGKQSQYRIRSFRGLWERINESEETILQEGRKIFFKSKSSKWDKAKLLGTPGIYYVESKVGDLIYIGETTNIKRRHHMHSNRTYISALRRHIGTDIFGFGFVGRKKFTDSNEKSITNYLRSCKFAWMEVSFGRLELEEYLIKNYQPKLNRKAK